MKRALTLVLCLTLAGCAARPIHPGAANRFDSTTYDTLVTSKSVIDTTKTDLANNAFPAAVAANVKTAVNGLVVAYNTLDTAYQAYHKAALSGSATQAQTDAVNSASASVVSATQALTNAKGAK